MSKSVQVNPKTVRSQSRKSKIKAHLVSLLDSSSVSYHDEEQHVLDQVLEKLTLPECVATAGIVTIVVNTDIATLRGFSSQTFEKALREECSCDGSSLGVPLPPLYMSVRHFKDRYDSNMDSAPQPCVKVTFAKVC
jgi:hypothetical protein